MERSAVKASQESDVTTPAEPKKLDFDDDTLRVIADVYKNEGNDAYKRKDFINAIHFYTEGIKVNCKDDELNAKLYSNRATAHFYQGNFHVSLNDARAAIQLQPTFIKAIARGASACVELRLFEEAITWCDKGLAINKNFKILLDLRSRSVDELDKLQATKQKRMNLKGQESGKRLREGIDLVTAVKTAVDKEDFTRAIVLYERIIEMVKEEGGRSAEGKLYGELGSVYYKLTDYKKAIDCYELQLRIAKEISDRPQEWRAYVNLGNAYLSLGDFTNAIHFHESCLKIARELEDRPREAIAYGNLGAAYNGLGDLKKAVEVHEKCLKIAKEIEDRRGEGRTYGNLGATYYGLGDYKKAIDCSERSLKISKESEDRRQEGHAYGNLGNAYNSLGDLKKAIDYLELYLKISKELKDRPGEGSACGNLGEAYRSLGDLGKAKYYFELQLKIAKEVKDRAGEGHAYGRLGKVYDSLGDLSKAVDYHKHFLNIAKEVKNSFAEGRAYGQLGSACERLGDFQSAVDYHKLRLKIAKEVEDKFGEGCAYGDLGDAYCNLGDFKKAIECHKNQLRIAKQMENVAQEGIGYSRLGFVFEELDSLQEALDCFQSSVRAFNDVRARLQSKDEWKIGLRDMIRDTYTALWSVLLKLDRSEEALCAAEKGRAQALNDLMELKYGIQTVDTKSSTEEQTIHDLFSDFQCSIIFPALHEGVINFWVIQTDKSVCRTVKEVGDLSTRDDVINSVHKVLESTFDDIGVRAGVDCEDRSLNTPRKPSVAKESSNQAQAPSPPFQKHRLRRLYNDIIDPIAHLIHGDEIVIVPEGPLWLAPYAAFVDSNSKYLSESFRIRVIPSLTSLKLIADCPADYHCKTGVLLVGDPWVQEVVSYNLCQLQCAREEVEMIGRILNTASLTGKEATKDKVLQQLSSVALVHIAAHGRMETGEIALCPNPSRASREPKDEDFLLTMSDVLNVKLRARLVVLSCCHSGRGEIKAEGVVGIARAFLGAGARSVLVSLWAIDDEATLEFMKYFYQHLVEGRSASEALNSAMKCMRKSNEFNEVKYWAPFVLIGDDVTLEVAGSD